MLRQVGRVLTIVVAIVFCTVPYRDQITEITQRPSASPLSYLRSSSQCYEVSGVTKVKNVTFAVKNVTSAGKGCHFLNEIRLLVHEDSPFIGASGAVT